MIRTGNVSSATDDDVDALADDLLVSSDVWDCVEAEMRLCGSCALDREVHAEARFFSGNAAAFIACPGDSCS